MFLPLPRRSVAGADSGGESSQFRSRGSGSFGDSSQRSAQVAVDIVIERLERGEVKDFQDKTSIWREGNWIRSNWSTITK